MPVCRCAGVPEDVRDPLPEVPRARAGRYVSVRVLVPDGAHQLRQYSLSSDLGDELRRITVKRVAGADGAPDGEVSDLLHERTAVGDELTLSVPFGDVALDDADTPLVLVPAGIGCAPRPAGRWTSCPTRRRSSGANVPVPRSPTPAAG
ncbi:hypothetical protein GCM10010266_41370 [Streptomyces griseomycini]|nr:hypothetical protein GCM10010266_41370 [Streptomyces griseomycini]